MLQHWTKKVSNTNSTHVKHQHDSIVSWAYKNVDVGIYLTAVQPQRAASVAEELWYTVTHARCMQV